MNIEVSGTTWKKKQQTSQFQLLEMHLVKWVDRVNYQHIISNDFAMIKVAVEELVVELSSLPNLIQMLGSNEAKTWVHNNDADTGPASS